MRKHIYSTLALCVMIALAAGSVDTTNTTTTSTSRSNVPSSPSTINPKPGTATTTSENAEVEKIFANLQQQYEVRHQAWKAANEARADAEREIVRIEEAIASLAKERPSPPVFELRSWATVVGNYKTDAALVDTDNNTATLRKEDGKPVTVPKDKLNAESRIYIEKVFGELSQFKKQFAEWTERSSTLEKERNAEEQKVASANEAEPEPPSRELIASEVSAMNAKKREEQVAAKAEADRKASAIAAARAEEELDVSGLVLMRKTLSGKTGDFGGTITGIVENRRSRKLNYAQITFNLYDESGAQVGSALANINGLEPGGKWKFEANSFGKDFSTYKFSDLTGF